MPPNFEEIGFVLRNHFVPGFHLVSMEMGSFCAHAAHRAESGILGQLRASTQLLFKCQRAGSREAFIAAARSTFTVVLRECARSGALVDAKTEGGGEFER